MSAVGGLFRGGQAYQYSHTIHRSSSSQSSSLDLEEVIEKTDALYISFEQYKETLQQLHELQQRMKKMETRMAKLYYSPLGPGFVKISQKKGWRSDGWASD